MSTKIGTTGAKRVLNSLGVAKGARERLFGHIIAGYTGWLLAVFVAVVYLVSGEPLVAHPEVLWWLGVYVAYQAILMVLSRYKRGLYETPLFRMVRIQLTAVFSTILVWLTGGSQSPFWYVYLWPIFAAAIYFESRWVTFAVYGEAAVLYFLASLGVGRVPSEVDFASLLVNLSIMLMLSAVLRYLMESIRMYQVAEAKLKHSEILQQIQQDIDSAVGLQEVLDRILRRAVELVGTRDGSLMLMDEEGKLCFRARVGELFPEDKEKRGFEVGEGIAGWVALNRKPCICHDTRTDTVFVPIIPGSFPIRSLVSVPIISHGTVLGVINVDSAKPNHFSAADAELLMTLANQTAVAIERAELLDSLRQIGEKTLSGAEDLYEYIVDAVHRLTRCPVAMWRVDETGKQARIVAFRGISVEYAQKTRLDLDHSVTGRAIRERKIIPVLDIQADPDFQKKKEAAREGWQSMLAVPLLAGPERTVGTLSIYSKIKREEFTSWELDLLRACASQAGVAIRNTTLIEELKVLNEIGQAVSVLDVEAIAELVYQKASQLMDITNFFLCLYDKDEEELHFIIWMYDGEPLEPFSCELSGLTGWVVREKEPLLIGDWDEEEQRFPAKADIITERQRSWLGVPLLVGEEMIGAISVQSPEPYAFNLDTQRLLETIASQAAIAIKNARLHADLECRIGRLQTLNQASGELGAELNTEAIFEIAVKAVVQTLDCTHCTIFALEDGLLVPQASHSKDKDIKITRCFALGEGLAGWVAQKGESLLAQDAKKDEHFSKGETRPEVNRSMVVVPLKIDDEVIGVISADQDRVNAFDEQDLQTVETLASQAGTALEKARAYKHSRQQLDALREIVGAIGVETDPLPIILTEATELFGAEYSSFSLVDSEAGQLAFRAMWEKGQLLVGEWIPGDKKVRRWEEGIVGHVAQTGQAYRTGNVREDPYYLEWYKSTGSELAVPLKGTDGETIGVLNLESPMRNAFSQAEEDLCQDLANVAATAIEKDRLFDAEQRLNTQLEILHQVVQERSVKEVLDRTLEGINAILGEEASSSIARYSERTDSFYEYRAAGPLRGYLLQVPPRPIGTGRHIIDTKEPLYLDDVHNPPSGCPAIRKESMEKGVRSFAALPLKWQEQMVGALFINVQRSISFTNELQRILQLFASQAAIAIENTRLYQDLERRITELEVLTEIGRTVSNLGIDEILDLVYEQAGEIIDLRDAQVQIAFYDEAKDEVAFPLAMEQDDGKVTDVVRRSEREDDYREAEGFLFDAGLDFQSELEKDILSEALRREFTNHQVLLSDSVTITTKEEGNNEWRISDKDELYIARKDLAIYTAKADELRFRVKLKFQWHLRNCLEKGILSEALRQEFENHQIALSDKVAITTEGHNTWRITDEGQSYIAKEYQTLGIYKAEERTVEQFKPRPRGTRFGLTEYVIDTKQPVLIVEDFEKQAEKRGIQVWPTFGRMNRPTHSWLGVPMIVQDRVIGIISIQSLEQEQAFDQGHQKLLATVANQAAVAIENARLLARETRRAQQLAGLQEIGVKITSQLDLEEVLDSIVENVNRIVPADFSTLFLYNLEEDRFEKGVRKGNIGIEPTIPSNTGFAARIAKTREAVFAEDAEKQPGVKPTFIEAKKVKSFAGVPLLFGGRTVGVLYVNFFEHHGFSEEERQMIHLLANQAAVAIENARLYAEMEKRVEERTNQLLDARRKLEAADKLALANQVGGLFAHRINNMVGTIDGRVNYVRRFLISTAGQDHKATRMLDGITEDIELLRSAAGTLRGITTPSQPIILDIFTVIDEALDRVSRSRVDFERIHIEKKLEAYLGSVLADEFQLANALENLINNAADATIPLGGTLSIIARNIEHHGQPYVELTVTDTGIGMSEEQMSHMFDLFYTTKEKGLGFGLWHDQVYLRSIGGDITVTSQLGRGTTFTIVLPITQDGQKV